MRNRIAALGLRLSNARSRLLAPTRGVIQSHWLGMITISLLAAATAVFFLSEDISRAGQFGDFVAGFSAALAFLWLIASFRLQSREITLQREELTLQRKALVNQVIELKNTAKFSSLSQIAAIMERAVKRISDSGLQMSKPTDINTQWFRGMQHWKYKMGSE